ncbi:hypothetical protein [Saccharicrinis sp. 156]|uniref:hypothetical protein n=1 Tax=Saccharicrinis sp. 156 TaxID=3417574 RepID=UPI003D326403
MKNPYIVLGISPNATKQEIQKAAIIKQREIIKTKEIKPQELMEYKKMLLSPEKRLMADFLFPRKITSKRVKMNKINSLEIENSLDPIDNNAFDSL